MAGVSQSVRNIPKPPLGANYTSIGERPNYIDVFDVNNRAME